MSDIESDGGELIRKLQRVDWLSFYNEHLPLRQVGTGSTPEPMSPASSRLDLGAIASYSKASPNPPASEVDWEIEFSYFYPSFIEVGTPVSESKDNRVPSRQQSGLGSFGRRSSPDDVVAVASVMKGASMRTGSPKHLLTDSGLTDLAETDIKISYSAQDAKSTTISLPVVPESESTSTEEEDSGETDSIYSESIPDSARVARKPGQPDMFLRHSWIIWRMKFEKFD